jgi:hypothetical protein
VRLVDLMPRWIHPNIFAFLCPHCRDVFLTCKNVVLSTHEQCEITEQDPLGLHGVTVVLCKDSCAWAIVGTDFASMSVTPSLDASAAGHWHGNITAGAIV